MLCVLVSDEQRLLMMAAAVRYALRYAKKAPLCAAVAGNYLLACSIIGTSVRHADMSPATPFDESLSTARVAKGYSQTL